MTKAHISIIFYGLFGLILPLQLSGQVSGKVSWKKGEPGNATLFWDPSCTRPQILVEEDFTDSAFNGYNAGSNGRNWQFFAGGVAFRRPNNRTSFPLAVTRNPYVGAGGWAGVLWGNRINPSLGHADPNLVEYKIDKQDDIFVTRFRAFSDFAHRNERAGVEVANMETRMVLCPDPDYCHDLSFEAKQCFYTRPQDDLQLETNIENTTDRSPLGARRAHYNNLTTRANLNKEYDNLVIWRNDPFLRKCNIEQWGAANYGDFWLDSHMVSKLDPGNRYAIVSEVQVSLFAADTNFTLVRDSIVRQKAQIGILNVHSGITKRSDFNLDYRTDTADLAILKANAVSGSTTQTIRTGDATNDQRTNAEDANALTAFWSDSTQYPDSARASVVLDIFSLAPNLQARFRVDLQNLSYFSISGGFGAGFTDSSGLGAQSDIVTQENTNSRLAMFRKEGYQTENAVFNITQTGTQVPDFSTVLFTVNYLGSCQARGFSFNLDSIFYYTGIQKESMDEHLIFNKKVYLPSRKTISLSVSDLTGKTLYSASGNAAELSGLNPGLPKGIHILRIWDADSRQSLGTFKIWIP
jgi:hypothetical protein